jgi:hypothetical protein
MLSHLFHESGKALRTKVFNDMGTLADPVEVEVRASVMVDPVADQAIAKEDLLAAVQAIATDDSPAEDLQVADLQLIAMDDSPVADLQAADLQLIATDDSPAEDLQVVDLQLIVTDSPQAADHKGTATDDIQVAVLQTNRLGRMDQVAIKCRKVD